MIILGSNGSGKSSLLKLIDHRYAASHGKVLLDHKPISSYSNKALAKFLITLTQNPLDSLFGGLTVYENCCIAFEPAEHGEEKLNAHERKKFFEHYLADFNSNLPKHLSHLVSSLSGGEQQSLALAMACLARPKLLLLDEHTSALDPYAADRLMAITAEMVERYGITCLLTTHNLSIAEKYGSRLLAIQNGKIVRDYDAEEKSKMRAEDLREVCY